MGVICADSRKSLFVKFLVPFRKNLAVVIRAGSKELVRKCTIIIQRYSPPVGIFGCRGKVKLRPLVQFLVGMTVADFHAIHALGGRFIAFLDVTQKPQSTSGDRFTISSIIGKNQRSVARF